ncbi:ABC transporter substrate-binding protein [Pseudoalteromonas sp. MMG010]|uniref:ABC transporter substrate-binding protein n=1 Tax=Pseudoalteromonas sp. MMG010 TaxID=2822685 RepID=UPI001B39D1F5|nr:ABC transporter substrate-binding protein [Pseudoalteromonas sp. MMG010]MBQ4833158.1 ABC transporter substrate-binding protein [Pseudoalteromonas sp. MMG010]
MKRNIFILLALFFSTLVSAQYPVTVTIKGKNITFNTQPKRIVVYDFGELDTLDSLGVKPIAIAKGMLPEYLSQYRDKALAGSLFKPDFAALKRLKPDLIIIGARTRAMIAQLSDIAPTLDMSISPKHFLKDMQQNLTQYGEIFNLPDVAQQRWVTLAQKISQLQREGRQQGTGLVLFTMKNEFIIHQPGDRFGMLYPITGLAAISLTDTIAAQHSSAKQQDPAKITAMLKAYLSSEPNWILLLDRGLATGGKSKMTDALKQFPIVRDFAAWQHKRVFQLDANQWYLLTGGYRSVLNFVVSLNNAFNNPA